MSNSKSVFHNETNEYLREDISLNISFAQASTLLEAMIREKESDVLNKDFNQAIIDKLNDIVAN